MKIAVSSDEEGVFFEGLVRYLIELGHEVVILIDQAWAEVSHKAAKLVADGEVDEAIVCCWTGTGASIAANKVSGVRAALCSDAETARGARIYNHANVLALSERATSIPIMKEIVAAWFSIPSETNSFNLSQISMLD